MKKADHALLTFDNSPISMKEKLKSISKIVKKLIGNQYATELGFENDESNIIIKGIKTMTDFTFDSIN